MRWIRLAALAVGVSASAVPAVAQLAPTATIAHAPRAAAAVSNFGWSSYNWSGYAQSGSYHSIAGQWTVPAVTSSSGSTYSSAWIGIDGFTNGNLIQTGTESDWTGGHAHYGAWWEILPAPETVITTMTIHPGDRMSASITKGTGTWKITIKDLTTGQSFTTNQVYAGPGTSAEWIVERPQVNGSLATLAKYGRATFDLGKANGAAANLQASQSGYMVANNGTTRISTPSNPDTEPAPAKPDGFAAAYGATQPAPPGS